MLLVFKFIEQSKGAAAFHAKLHPKFRPSSAKSQQCRSLPRRKIRVRFFRSRDGKKRKKRKKNGNVAHRESLVRRDAATTMHLHTSCRARRGVGVGARAGANDLRDRRLPSSPTLRRNFQVFWSRLPMQVRCHSGRKDIGLTAPRARTRITV